MAEQSDNVINFGIRRLFRQRAPWETEAQHKIKIHEARKAANEIVLARLRGIAPNAAGPDDNDPRNPNVPTP